MQDQFYIALHIWVKTEDKSRELHLSYFITEPNINHLSLSIATHADPSSVQDACQTWTLYKAYLATGPSQLSG